jgi:imidazolonepropionase
MTSIITNIQSLVNVREESHLLHGKEMSMLPCIEDAYLIVEGDEIAEYGKMENLPPSAKNHHELHSAEGGTVLPCWCDSHTHLVFAGSRENEFVDKINGLNYAQIFANGGGILNSAKKLQETSADDLFNLSWRRLDDLAKKGTGAIEIKSGYGLTVESELKMLRVIKKLKEKSGMLIKASFLGAHAFPMEFRENHSGYIDLLVNELLPVIAAEKLADFIDVFCEKGFFSVQETETICNAGARFGLKPKLHLNQLNSIGGIEAGIMAKAISLDHLETLNENDIRLLSQTYPPGMPERGGQEMKPWTGVCTLLPSAAFFLRMAYPPARNLIDSGAAVALASDFNPGSSPSGNMNLVVSMGCIQMRMLPEEAINAASINGAYAMELGEVTGSITPGKKANLILTAPIPSLAYLPYAFGSNLIDRVMIRGEWKN